MTVHRNEVSSSSRRSSKVCYIATTAVAKRFSLIMPRLLVFFCNIWKLTAFIPDSISRKRILCGRENQRFLTTRDYFNCRLSHSYFAADTETVKRKIERKIEVVQPVKIRWAWNCLQAAAARVAAFEQCVNWSHFSPRNQLAGVCQVMTSSFTTALWLANAEELFASQQYAPQLHCGTSILIHACRRNYQFTRHVSWVARKVHLLKLWRAV